MSASAPERAPESASGPAPESPLESAAPAIASFAPRFVPAPWMSNPHLQTLVGNYLRRPWSLPAPETLLVEAPPSPADDAARRAGYPPTQLVSLCHWQPPSVRRGRLTVVLLHGLEGSASSRYMLGNASRAWAAGCNVVRMNMRSCGGSDALAPTIYHSGRSADVAAVVRALVRDHCLERVALVGYSMGGNLVLNYAGEQTGLHGAGVPALLAAVGVSPLMDLATSSAALHEPQNRVYEWKFLRSMKRRLRIKAELFPALYGALAQEGVYRRIRSMRDFDGEIVARYGGFCGADDYYASVASSRHASGFAVPTLILHALDDPFVRMLASTRRALRENPHVSYIETSHGGHCAFVGQAPGADRHWAERTLIDYLMRYA